jgi:hypothetical protein
VFAAFVLAVLALAIWLRFRQITSIGMSGSDNFWYWTVGRMWSDGIMCFQVTEGLAFFRPVTFALDAAAFVLFGEHDWTIKALNASLDVLSVAMIILVASKLLGDRWLGLAIGLLCAINPALIRMARMELVHTQSLFFLVLLYFALLALLGRPRGPRPLPKDCAMSFAAGLLIACAGATHEDLLWAAPGVFLTLVVSPWVIPGSGYRWRRSVARGALFSIGVVSIILSFSLVLGLERIKFMFFRVKRAVTNVKRLEDSSFGGRLEDLCDTMEVTVGPAAPYVFAVGAIALVVLWILVATNRARQHRSLLLVLTAGHAAVVSYILTFSILLPDRPMEMNAGRLLLPVLTFLLPAAWAAIFLLARLLFASRPILPLAAGISFLSIWGIPLTAPEPIESSLEPHRPSRLRWIHNNVVHASAEPVSVLICPTYAASNRPGLEEQVYFGHNEVLYLRMVMHDHPDLSFHEILRQEEIRYVILQRAINRPPKIRQTVLSDRILLEKLPNPKRLLFDMSPAQRRLERTRIREHIVDLGAQRVATGIYGEIFKLPDNLPPTGPTGQDGGQGR